MNGVSFFTLINYVIQSFVLCSPDGKCHYGCLAYAYGCLAIKRKGVGADNFSVITCLNYRC